MQESRCHRAQPGLSPPFLFVIVKGQDKTATSTSTNSHSAKRKWGGRPRRTSRLTWHLGRSSAGAVSVTVAKQNGTGRVFYNWSELGGVGSGWIELPGQLTDTTPAAALIGTDAQGGKLSPPFLFVIVKGQGQDRNLYFNQLTLGQAQVGWQRVSPDYGS